MELNSDILQRAVDAFGLLPGVGKRSALRYALHVLQMEDNEARELVDALVCLKRDIHFCKRCHCVSDTELCGICSNPKRQQTVVCVVENIQDVMAIENTHQYTGLYHVLGGVISPIDGIGIHDLNIDSLLKRVQEEHTEEVILALPTTMEGDTTNFYLNKQLRPLGVKISTIARGIAIGDNLEYADEVTLGSSIVHRVPFEG